jgi:hypothetical protein
MASPAASTAAPFRSKIVDMSLPEGVVIVDVPVSGGGGDDSVCADCEKPLRGAPFVVIDGALLCMDCVEVQEVDDDEIDDDDDEDGDEFDDEDGDEFDDDEDGDGPDD